MSFAWCLELKLLLEDKRCGVPGRPHDYVGAREVFKNPQVKYRGELHPHLTWMLRKRDVGDAKLFTSRRRWCLQKTGRPEAPVRSARAITRQRPTLAGPIVLLPLAAEGLTAVFGMGTGGAPRL